MGPQSTPPMGPQSTPSSPMNGSRQAGGSFKRVEGHLCSHLLLLQLLKAHRLTCKDQAQQVRQEAKGPQRATADRTQLSSAWYLHLRLDLRPVPLDVGTQPLQPVAWPTCIHRVNGLCHAMTLVPSSYEVVFMFHVCMDVHTTLSSREAGPSLANEQLRVKAGLVHRNRAAEQTTDIAVCALDTASHLELDCVCPARLTGPGGSKTQSRDESTKDGED